METPVHTQFGEVPLADLVRAYEQKKQKINERNEWFKTDAGREYNRMKAKQYYDKNKEKILEKRMERYDKDGEALRKRSLEYYHKNSEVIKKKNKERREAVEA
jgi:hypothetical protein